MFRRWRWRPAIHDRLPERGLLDILTRTAYQIGIVNLFGLARLGDHSVRG